MPRRIHLHVHTKIYPNLKSISELFKMNMKSLDSFTLASRDDNQTLGCLHLYGDRRISRAQRRINAYEILLQHYWLLFFLDIIGSQKLIPTYNTDRLLAAGNEVLFISDCITKRQFSMQLTDFSNW